MVTIVCVDTVNSLATNWS